MRDPSVRLGPLVGTSVDALWKGRVLLEQPLRAQGYRFNLDSVLLAGFVAGRPDAHALDLGAGCGIIGCLLLLSGKARRITAVERQVPLAELALANGQRNELATRMKVVCGDLREQPLGPCDFVVFNPPYAEFHASRASACLGRDEARRECHGTLHDFVAAGARALAAGGTLSAILPYARRHDFCAAAKRHGLAVTRWQAVLAYDGSPPRHVLLEACASGGERQTLAPLVVHRPDGAYTEAVAELTTGPALLNR